MKKIIFVSLFILMVITPFTYAADQPLDTMKAAIDQAIKILNDPKYQAESEKTAQRDAIWKVISHVFDLEGIAKITLGRNWRQFNESEKKEFTEVFGHFLGNNYVERIQSSYSGEKVDYLGQEMIGDDKAMVRTKIVRTGASEIPVDYRMHKTGKGWQVYDVIIEGVSLVKNYRTQFNSFLMRNKPQQLIETIKKKL